MILQLSIKYKHLFASIYQNKYIYHKELQLARQLSPVYVSYYLKYTPLINTLKPVGKPLPNLPYKPTKFSQKTLR